jgi:hypothetical protein
MLGLPGLQGGQAKAARDLQLLLLLLGWRGTEPARHRAGRRERMSRNRAEGVSKEGRCNQHGLETADARSCQYSHLVLPWQKPGAAHEGLQPVYTVLLSS